VSLDQCFLFGEILSNFNLKNMIFTHTNHFSWKKGPDLPDFEIVFPKSPVYYDEFQWVAKNIERFFFFSYLVCNQI